MPSITAPARFQSLDALRGIAALMVVVYHCSTSRLALPEGALGAVFLYGVSIFFAISGYAILTTAQFGRATIRQFIVRRWRRIYIPYWASIVVALGVALAALPFNAGRLTDLWLPAEAWLAVATLTQGFTPWRDAINAVYWTLGHEEQFYLVVAATLAAPARWRPALLTAVSVAAALYMLPAMTEHWIPGLFLRHWLSFACGAAAAMWLHTATGRGWALAIAGCVGSTLVLSGTASLGFAAAAALAMVALWRFDGRIAGSALARPLRFVGTFSFSLYLVHVPIGGRVVNLLNRVDLPAVVVVAGGVAASLLAGWLFYAAVERRVMLAWRRGTPSHGTHSPATVNVSRIRRGYGGQAA